MALITGGAFEMGSPTGEADQRPVRLVKVGNFYMDVYEVTQESFLTLMGQNPSKFANPKGPVERVRWTDAVRYCNARSKKEGFTPCYNEQTWNCDFSANGYRLPAEAEWEYASRAGSKDNCFFGGGKADLEKYAWHRGNSAKKPHEVGAKLPNAFHLHDIYGNVSEWCHDYYAENYYAVGANENPRGPDSGSKRVLRGGSWDDRDSKCNSVIRQKDSPTTADICQGYDTYGFRCVRNAQ
ncbi:MAG: formylglycine-generating enzyme family protein [Verrucomicrobiae bacterium]|nr:formylglycine-generating enzyme family protein [Verrucomicrobiae bacterium]